MKRSIGVYLDYGVLAKIKNEDCYDEEDVYLLIHNKAMTSNLDTIKKRICAYIEQLKSKKYLGKHIEIEFSMEVDDENN